MSTVGESVAGGAAAGFAIGLASGWIVVGVSTGDWSAEFGPTVQNWTYLCGLIGGVFAGSRSHKRKKQQAQAAEQQAQAAKQHAQAAEARRQQETRESYLSKLLSHSQRDFLRLREMNSSAENHLDRADQEFAEGAFAPFWDEIEHATQKLAAYQHGIETINRNAIEYRREAANLPTPISPFNLPIGQLPDGRVTANRLKTIVRNAQKNFKFASIYEQRKTNKILVAGFGTLASTIYAIGDSITSSLDDLSTNFHTSLDELLEETREHSRRAKLAADQHSEILAEQSKQAAAEANRRRQFEREVVENQEEQVRILKDINRGRRPSP